MRKPLSFFCITAIASLSVILVIIFLFWTGSRQKHPTVPELPQPNSSPNITDNLDYLQVKITPQNVQRVIKALTRPSSYYIETKSELYYDHQHSTYLRRKWTRNQWSRVDLFDTKNTLTMHVIFCEQFAFFWYPNSPHYTRLPIGNFSADESQMMMVYEDILELNSKDILDAKLTQVNGEDCIYVEVTRSDLNYTERYWVSVANGLLLLGQTLQDGKLIYSVQTLKLDLSTPENDTFTLPGNHFVGDVMK